MTDASDKRIDTLEGELTEVTEAVRSEIKSLRADFDGAHETVNRRLAELEANSGTCSEIHTIRKADLPSATQSTIVVLDPEHGYGQQYGLASPLVEEWRSARDAYRAAADRLTKVASEVHLPEIEIALIEIHRLTLPPADYPWYRFDLEEQTRRRKRRLAVVQVELRRARVRCFLCRICTFGLRK